MRRIIWAALAGALLAACAASSGVRETSGAMSVFAELPPDAPVYIRIDAERSRELLDDALALAGLGGKTLKAFMDKTFAASLALYPRANRTVGGGSGRTFALAGSGKNYPVAASSLSFFFSPSWKKVRSATGKKYWRSSKSRISLFIRRNKAYISDGDPFFDGSGAEPPSGFAFFSEGSSVSAWINDMSLLNNALERLDIPITVPADAIYIAAFEEDDVWQAVFRLETPSAAQARGLVSVLSMARSAFARGYITGSAARFARLLLSEAPLADGSALVIKSPVMARAEFAALIVSLQTAARSRL